MKVTNNRDRNPDIDSQNVVENSDLAELRTLMSDHHQGLQEHVLHNAHQHGQQQHGKAFRNKEDNKQNKDNGS